MVINRQASDSKQSSVARKPVTASKALSLSPQSHQRLTCTPMPPTATRKRPPPPCARAWADGGSGAETAWMEEASATGTGKDVTSSRRASASAAPQSG